MEQSDETHQDLSDSIDKLSLDDIRMFVMFKLLCIHLPILNNEITPDKWTVTQDHIFNECMPNVKDTANMLTKHNISGKVVFNIPQVMKPDEIMTQVTDAYEPMVNTAVKVIVDSIGECDGLYVFVPPK